MSLFAGARRRAIYALRVATFKRRPMRPGDVVFLGDSITAKGAWQHWLPEASVCNLGIGGDTSKGVLGRLDQALDQPASLLLMIGTNDVGDGVPAKRILSNVRTTILAIGARSPGTRIVLHSVLPRTAELAQAIRFLNSGLEEIAAATGSTYVDLFELLADDRGAIRPEFSDDHLHLSPAAYVVWLDAIRPLVLA
jgi:lysophospholipase L1-like esterase